MPSKPKNKPAQLARFTKVNRWLIGIGVLAIVAVGVAVVRMSFAGTQWPGDESYAGESCGVSSFTSATEKDFPELYNGSIGPCVITLKKGLRQTGFFPTDYATDAVFGAKTVESVVKMQTYYELKDRSGDVGPCTWYALQQATAGDRSDIAAVRAYVESQKTGCL